MAYVLLGFLCLKALSQYEILKALKMRVSPFYQPSLGSIQTTLKKLLGSGYIAVEETREGRKKNTYRITEEGKKVFFQWMCTDDYEESAAKLDAQLSTRLFFLGLLQPPEQKQAVKTAADALGKILTEYTAAHERYSKTPCPPSFQEVARYQLKTLSLGIQQLKSTKDWLDKLYIEMEEEQS